MEDMNKRYKPPVRLNLTASMASTVYTAQLWCKTDGMILNGP